MTAIFLTPFAVQGALMFWDELYFHRQRGLPLWERVGHPVDSGVLGLFYLFLLLVPPSTLSIAGAMALAAISCLVITKDEWVHQIHCSPMEHWLHAVLFILHPLVCIGAGYFWWAWHGKQSPLGFSFSNIDAYILPIMFIATVVFMIQQIVYWSFFRPLAKDQREN